MGKLIETYDVDDYEIWTDSGWHDLTHFHKTVAYDVWVISTENFELECADDHILFKNDDYEETFCKNLKVGDLKQIVLNICMTRLLIAKITEFLQTAF